MSKDIPYETYPLIPSQDTMYLMVKYSIHKQITQVPTSISIGNKLDFEILKKAFNIELGRNDSLRIRFFKDKGGVLKQYFIPEYSVDDVPVMKFKTELEQNAYFEKDAQTPIKFLKGEIFRIVFFTSYNGKSGIYLNVSHLAMDAAAVAIFYMDMLAIYKALVTGDELPKPLAKYEDYVKKELEMLSDKEKYKKGEQFYKDYWLKYGEPFYAGVHGPNILDKARKKDPNVRVPVAYDPIHDKADLIYRHVDDETANKIYNFCMKTGFAPECMFQMGFRTRAASINYRTDDVLMMQLCSKRMTVKEKNMGGCLTQPLQIRTVMKETDTFTDCLKNLFSTRTQLYRHLNFPYIDARNMQRDLFGFGISQAPSSLMYTWLPIPMISGEKGVDFEFKGYNLGRYIMPLYIFSFPNMKKGGIDFFYMYRTNTITANQINALHENAMKVINKGIDNPDITLGELMDIANN